MGELDKLIFGSQVSLWKPDGTLTQTPRSALPSYKFS